MQPIRQPIYMQKDSKDKVEMIKENERCSCRFVMCQRQEKLWESVKFGDNDRYEFWGKIQREDKTKCETTPSMVEMQIQERHRSNMQRHLQVLLQQYYVVSFVAIFCFKMLEEIITNAA